jgi:transcriptional regulator with XRE-family HTH domain
VNDAQVGRAARAVRVRLRWRQIDLWIKAGLSQQVISRFERGRFDEMSLATIRQIVRALDGRLDLIFGWRGAALDRLLDERHAALVDTVRRLLEAAGWMVTLEVSYSEFGERGSIDLLAFHPATGLLVVVEVKTEIGSVEATFRKHDEKARLGGTIARRRFGWAVRGVSRLLVLPDAPTPRRQVGRFTALFDRAYPLRGWSAKRWLNEPRSEAHLLLFLSSTRRGSGSQGSLAVQRVRAPRRQTPTHESPSPITESPASTREDPDTTPATGS